MNQNYALNRSNHRASAPWPYWAISGVCLLWNLTGIIAFITQIKATPEQLVQSFGQQQADLIIALPGWYTLIFGLAVFGGALGCIALLLRSKWALPLFALSLVCVAVQDIYLLVSGAFAQSHQGEWVMSVLIIIVAVFLLWFARRARAQHILR